jgi:FAD/FMN-containing dehydrogenases
MIDFKFKGAVIRRNDPGFDEAIKATLFNKREPGRRPELMVTPRDVEDVIAAVRYAKSAGLRVSVCSGGHSWSANHLRPDSLLINMKNFCHYEVNRENMTATAGPACGGSVLLTELLKQGLFFPAGHCKGVCIGGYLLQGGFAWNGRKLGMACESIIGHDIVTADGRVVHASATENPDLYWAARGCGAGFFGVVLRFHLKLYPRPKYIGMAAHIFGTKHLEDVFNWAYEVGPSIPNSVEFQMLMSRKTLSAFGPGIEAIAPIFADSRDELEEAQRFLVQSPIRRKAYARFPFIKMPISWMYSMAMSHYPHQHHWGVDNMWTGAKVGDLMPYLKKIAHTLPPAPSHLLWLNWHPPTRQDMAFSMEDKIYIALYGAWKNAADTPIYGNWATDWMQEMQPFATGIQLADESLHTRPARFVSDANLARLDAVRRQRDAGKLFHEWHSRPFMTATPGHAG